MLNDVELRGGWVAPAVRFVVRPVAVAPPGRGRHQSSLFVAADDVGSGVAVNQHRNARMGQHLVCFAAEQQGADPLVPVRRHENQVAFLSAGGFDDRLVRLVACQRQRVAFHAGGLGDAFGPTENFRGDDGFRLMEALRHVWIENRAHIDVHGRETLFGMVDGASAETRAKWLAKMRALGARAG